MNRRGPVPRRANTGSLGYAKTKPEKPKLGRDAERPIPVNRIPQRVQEYLKSLKMSVWFTGEIRDIRQSHQTLRFTLRESDVQLECVVWGGQADRLRGLIDVPGGSRQLGGEGIRTGDKVVALGTLGLDPGRVHIRLTVVDLRQHGVSPAAAERERVRRVLQRDGLLDPARKRRLPRLPRRIALITSADSAAQRDVEAVARRQYPGIPITLVPTQVQGAGAPRSLVEALGRASTLAGCDVILLCRGGGAAGELAAFDDEAVARAIARCPVPVVTGIGHETNTTLADCVADHRAATPTAAASVVIPIRKELEKEIEQLRHVLGAAMTRRLEREQAQLRHVRITMGQQLTLRVAQSRRVLDGHGRDIVAAPAKRIAGARLLVEQANGAIRAHLTLALERARSTRDLLDEQVIARSPFATLERGYALALVAGGRVLASTAEFTTDREFTLRLRDGEVRVRVVAEASRLIEESHTP